MRYDSIAVRTKLPLPPCIVGFLPNGEIFWHIEKSTLLGVQICQEAHILIFVLDVKKLSGGISAINEQPV